MHKRAKRKGSFFTLNVKLTMFTDCRKRLLLLLVVVVLLKMKAEATEQSAVIFNIQIVTSNRCGNIVVQIVNAISI